MQTGIVIGKNCRSGKARSGKSYELVEYHILVSPVHAPRGHSGVAVKTLTVFQDQAGDEGLGFGDGVRFITYYQGGRERVGFLEHLPDADANLDEFCDALNELGFDVK